LRAIYYLTGEQGFYTNKKIPMKQQKDQIFCQSYVSGQPAANYLNIVYQ